MKILLAILLAATVTAAPTSDTPPSPFQHGALPTTHVDIGSLLTIGLEENLDVWVPTEPGTYKVMYYLDGLGGVIPGEAYHMVMDHIASHGYVVVLMWTLTGPLNPNDKVPILGSVLDWAEHHLEDKLHHKDVPAEVHLDLDTLIGSGHSAGAHVLVEYLKHTCHKFQAQVLMSPVDGVDAGGYIPIFAVTPGEMLNYQMPTLNLYAGLDSVPGFSGFSCAPDFLSNDRFYDAMDSPKWALNATTFGHGDFLDPYYQHTIENIDFCAFNGEATEEELDAYRRFVAGETVAFLNAVFGDAQDCPAHLQYLEDPGMVEVPATARHSNPSNQCPVPGCSWSPMPSTTLPPTTVSS